jgi:CelD/BcsL family acetyltransferase involved in cellulose biosynthesis
MALPQMETVQQIRFPATHDEFVMSLAPKARQNLRRRTRNLEREQHVRLDRVTTAEQVPQFLDAVDRVFRDSWQAKTFGYASRNGEDQIRYYCGLARLGWLRSYVLMGEAGPLAYEIGFQHQGTFYCDEMAYRQEWSAFGPGSVLTNLIIEELYERDRPSIYDFGLGDLEHKKSLCNAEHPAAAIYLAGPGKRRAALIAQAALHSMERGARKTLQVMGLDEPVRRLLKRRK